MQTKLTISIDNQVIDQAKQYAKQKGQSLSSMIENYLMVVTQMAKEPLDVSAEIKELQGSVKLPADFDYKTELQKSLSKKYNL